MKTLHVIGMIRSGTTLLEKLLHHHPNLIVASQPYQLLYVKIKELYNMSKSINNAFPLNNYFLENTDTLQSFYKYLDSTTIDINDVYRWKKDMEKTYEKYAPELATLTFPLSTTLTFRELYLELHKALYHLYVKKNTLYIGTKEVLIEEYLPYILDCQKDSKGIIIIRDPRDVITSTNYGRHSDFVGQIRPVLFNLRNWRKSVAFALHLSDNPNFMMIRYEDLVTDYKNAMNRICDFLNIKKFDSNSFDSGLKTQLGSTWTSNSSFEASSVVSTDSIGKYKSTLPIDVIRYIESCCYPEMRLLGYNFEENLFDHSAITSFVEPYHIERKEFSPNYSVDPTHMKEELERFQMLQRDIDDELASTWFIFKDVFYQLKAAIE